MGIEVFGIEELKLRIKQTGDRAQRGVLDEMRKQAGEVRDLAVKFAPVDTGDLENAIKVKESSGGRDSTGRFVRKSIEVYVDVSAAGEYAYIMHEHLTPYGAYNLGPKSRAKQASQSEMVGGKYLERAAAERYDEIMQKVLKAARTFFF